MVAFKDSRSIAVLRHKFIEKKETLADYLEGLNGLEKEGFIIEGIVCDGFGMIFNFLKEKYKIQMCTFHQFKIIRRYLTKRPLLAASMELLKLAKFMFHTDKESFLGAFEQWTEKWQSFVNERVT